jgi:hypothetical protein
MVNALIISLVTVWFGWISPHPPSEEIPISREHARIYDKHATIEHSLPIRLLPGPYLFLDEHFIASSRNIDRIVTRPVRDESLANPVITGKEDGCFQPYMTVIRDSGSDIYRLWYGCRVEELSESSSHIGYMESEDGIHWKRPHKVLEDPGPIQFGVSIVDDGPACLDPEKRFKFAWWKDSGMKIATSADGIKFTSISNDPVIIHNHDITGLFYDPERKHYVATLSVYRESDDWEGKRRITMQSTSPDLLHWALPHHVLVPDYAIDEGELQFYAMDGYLQRGDLTIAMVKVLRDDLKADNPPEPPEAYGVGYTTLAWSRDGKTWTRDTVPYFEPDPRKGAWDHAHAWIDEQVPVNAEVYLYYGGYARGHKVNRFEERQIGLLKIEKDRYVARTATQESGEIVTPLIILDANTLSVNVNAAGGCLRIEVQDETGKPIPGFTRDENRAISSDVVAEPVRWAGTLDTLKGREVRLSFWLENAALYAFYIG